MFHIHALIHLSVHLVAWIVSVRFLKLNWRSRESGFILLQLLAANLIDIDHLLAEPIYDANRCSIGFHPLHSFWMMPMYAIGTLWHRTRFVAIGLLLHLAVDAAACA